jgi:nitrite reductase/ring-hydroxylating ferredoxin subunit
VELGPFRRAGGWLGGHLAYSLGVGVDTNAFETGPSEWTAVSVVRDGDAPLARAGADGVGLVFVESDYAIHVLADRCSHRGGPLSEGELTGDGCIQCPWHGSQFVITTGGVCRGPATIPQPTYEVRGSGSNRKVCRSESRALRNNTVRTY